MTEAQKTLYYIAENMKMDKSISKEGYKHFQQAIKALEEQNEWVLCSERMPKDNEEVLVTYGDRVIISRYMGAGYGFICGLVDAWMPLPQPWKGQKNDSSNL